MGLRIDQTYAKIDIGRTPASLEMQTQYPKLELHQKQARLNIHTEFPKLQIDQYEEFASAGLKGVTDMLREANANAYQHVMEYIGQTAEDGDRLAAIEKGGNPIADIAKEHAYPEHEFGVDVLPKVPPKFSVISGHVDIELEDGALNKVETNFTWGKINFNYLPSNVTISLKQYASISMKYEPNKINVYL